jgi:hypothetical protein
MFAYWLALKLGRANVEGLLAELTEVQYLEWWDFYAATHPAPQPVTDSADDAIAARLRGMADGARRKIVERRER